MSDMPTYEGGCLCGQVRWRAMGAPANVRICHCRLCQKATGGPFFARAIFPRDAFAWTGGTTAWNSSPRLVRMACGRCGTPMFAAPNDPPARIGVSLATFDDPAAVRPDCHIWVSAKLPWVTVADGLPQHDRGAPAA